MRGGGEFEGKKAKWPLTPAHALKVKKNKGASGTSALQKNKMAAVTNYTLKFPVPIEIARILAKNEENLQALCKKIKMAAVTNHALKFSPK